MYRYERIANFMGDTSGQGSERGEATGTTNEFARLPNLFKETGVFKCYTCLGSDRGQDFEITDCEEFEIASRPKGQETKRNVAACQGKADLPSVPLEDCLDSCGVDSRICAWDLTVKKGLGLRTYPMDKRVISR